MDNENDSEPHRVRRPDLQQTYDLKCPECGPGGVLTFDRGRVSYRELDDEVTELEGVHFKHGDPACSILEVRWTNFPNTDDPVLEVTQRSKPVP